MPTDDTLPAAVPGIDREAEVEMLRDALRRRVQQTSIRQTAAEVGMSHGGVHKIITGDVAPYGKTLARLRAWYLRRAPRSRDDLSPDTARFLVGQVVASLPPPQRGPAAEEVLELLERLHARYGAPAPAWLTELRRRGR